MTFTPRVLKDLPAHCPPTKEQRRLRRSRGDLVMKAVLIWHTSWERSKLSDASHVLTKNSDSDGAIAC